MTISRGPFLLPIHFYMLFFLWEIVELFSNYLLRKKYCKYKYEVFLSFVNTYFQKLASLEKKTKQTKNSKYLKKMTIAHWELTTFQAGTLWASN